MGSNVIVSVGSRWLLFRKILSGSCLVAGTTIGAGMLGIPLATAKAGFYPSLGITIATWVFMFCTGLLVLEVSLWLPSGSNLLSMAGRFLGNRGKWIVGGMYLFLYYALLVAYLAGGAPLLTGLFGVKIPFMGALLLFTALFTFITALGAKMIDRINLLLMAGLGVAYLLLIGSGSSSINPILLQERSWGKAFFALPVLFSAFGYHNVVPSLTTYLKKDTRALRMSILFGSLAALVVFLIWQWLVFGTVTQENLLISLKQGATATQALQTVVGNSWIFRFGQLFAFFALATSLLGVAFSMVDFLRDGLGKTSTTLWQAILSVATFLPPFILVLINPAIFDYALSIAGGIGEAFLNGMLPVMLVWRGRYRDCLSADYALRGGKKTLSLLFLAGLFVFATEVVMLLF